MEVRDMVFWPSSSVSWAICFSRALGGKETIEHKNGRVLLNKIYFIFYFTSTACAAVAARSSAARRSCSALTTRWVRLRLWDSASSSCGNNSRSERGNDDQKNKTLGLFSKNKLVVPSLWKLARWCIFVKF